MNLEKLSFLEKYNIMRDKVAHFLAGAAVFFIFSILTHLLFLGVAAVFAAGFGKEGFDWLVNYFRAKKGLPPAHTVDFLDAWATVAGGFCALFFVSLFL